MGYFGPARFVGFGVGMIFYATLVNFHFNEGITPKTWVSLGIIIFINMHSGILEGLNYLYV